MDKPTQTTETVVTPSAQDKVPLFARKLGRPNLDVRTGIRAGSKEKSYK